MRHAYWTILIDNAPTAFRARQRDDLLPTLKQLQHTQPTAVLKWFARGRLWESEEQARDASRQRPPRERRTREWRPGGAHRDPRARFAKGKRPKRPMGRRVAGTPGKRKGPR